MPWNGAGQFTRIYSWVTDAANGIFVSSTRTDTDSDDIATGISNCITRDNQAPPQTNITWAGYKITSLGSGTATTDAVNYGQVFNSPSFVTPTATTTPTLGSNNLRLATTAYVDQTAFSAALPAQGSIPYRAVITDGAGAASFGIARTPSTRIFAFRTF